MRCLDDLIASLDQANEKDIKEIHELANDFRELGDLFDEVVKEGISAEEIETIIGKIIVKFMKIK